MNGLLIRVGVDSSKENGAWNVPCSTSGRFCYVPIPADKHSSRGTAFDHTYDEFAPFVRAMGVEWPARLSGLCHLDPDFVHLTYGDGTKRANRIREYLHAGSFVAFWAGMRCIETQKRVCSLVGFFEVAYVTNSYSIGPTDSHRNAHSRLSDGREDVVIFARPERSGRLKTHIPIGEANLAPGWARAQQCIFPDLLAEWGQLQNDDGSYVKNGYIQRSANPPIFVDPTAFLAWFNRRKPVLIHANNV
jgi:Nucleotide modification associated domain 3